MNTAVIIQSRLRAEKPKRHLKLVQELVAERVGFVARNDDPRSEDVGNIYDVVGTGETDGPYFVKITKKGMYKDSDVLQAFVSEAQKVLNFPTGKKLVTMVRKDLRLAETGKLEPASPVCMALQAGVERGYKKAYAENRLEII